MATCHSSPTGAVGFDRLCYLLELCRIEGANEAYNKALDLYDGDVSFLTNRCVFCAVFRHPFLIWAGFEHMDCWTP